MLSSIVQNFSLDIRRFVAFNMSEEKRSLRSGSSISKNLFYGASKRDSSSDSDKDISNSGVSDSDSDY